MERPSISTLVNPVTDERVSRIFRERPNMISRVPLSHAVKLSCRKALTMKLHLFGPLNLVEQNLLAKGSLRFSSPPSLDRWDPGVQFGPTGSYGELH